MRLFDRSDLRVDRLATAIGAVVGVFGIAGYVNQFAALGLVAICCWTALIFSRLGQWRGQEAQGRGRTLFLANLGHEIRTPLNGMLGMTNLLLHTELTAEQRNYAKAAKESSEVLSTLLEDLLALSGAADAEKIEVQTSEFDPATMVESIAEMLAPKAAGKNLEISTSINANVPPIVTGEYKRVRQILMQLVGNGLNATDRGGVVIRLSVDPKTSDTQAGTLALLIEVSDTSAGVPEVFSRVFSDGAVPPPETINDLDTAGLGLLVSRRLLSAIGGWLDLRSNDYGGCTATITVPVSGRIRIPTMPWQPPVPRIMITSPSQVVRDSLADQLRDLSLPDAVTAVPDEIANHTDTFGPGRDVVVLIDGAGRLRPEIEEELIELRKIMPDVSTAHYVLLLAPGARTDQEWAKRAGFAGYLIKPVRRRALTRRLNAAFPNAGSPKLERTPSLPERRIDPLNILLAEDNEINARLATALLVRKGHTVHHVKNGQDAIDAAMEKGFDVILMDIHMPHLSGIDATVAIRRNEEKGVRVPIVALSANTDEEVRISCIEAGMDEHLAKPLDPNDLNKALAQISRTASNSMPEQSSG